MTLRELASLVSQLSIEIEALRGRVAELESSLEVDTFQVIPESENSTPETATGGYRVGDRREAIARNIGLWLHRALDGENRGNSGRSEIGLASRIYLVCRDFEGRVHNPPLVFSSWQPAKIHCIRQGDPGDSVFIGLPSKAEALIAVQSARLDIPASLGR